MTEAQMAGDAGFRERVIAARALARFGRLAEARAAFEELHRMQPGSPEVAITLVRFAQQRGDAQGAIAVLAAAAAANPLHEMLTVELAVARAGAGAMAEAVEGLRAFCARQPDAPMAWLLMGQMLDDTGRGDAALMARFEAISRAQAAGQWLDPAATPAAVSGLVGAAVATLRERRRDVFMSMIEPLRQEHGDAALRRVDLAVRGYLGELQITPPDVMQRPRYLYMPDLPAQPWMEPYLHPWAGRLAQAFPEIRDEALGLVLEEARLEDFVKVRDGDRIGNYLGGAAPSWEAFFFYRHGTRYDDNHARCPRTSAVLESLDLCRIPGQTPEICFSVLAAGTHILPHYGVTNTRAVMHLPLVVPADCALHLVDRGAHQWVEGELVMFDDTYLHEAWNRSSSVRIILLMDCWNPHLTPVEREAIVRLSRAIGALDVALRGSGWLAPERASA
jgi:aspartate beta-hydroxylase